MAAKTKEDLHGGGGSGECDSGIDSGGSYNSSGCSSSETFSSTDTSHSSMSYDMGYGKGYGRPIPAADMDSTSSSVVSLDVDMYTSPSASTFERSLESDHGYESGSLTETSFSEQKQVATIERSTSASKHFNGTPLQFLTMLFTILDFRSWDPVKDIKQKLGPELLEECRKLLWEQDEDDKEFEALNAARDNDERLVAFALFVAQSHKQLNTMNKDRQTVLHIAAEKCSPQLCRLLITRGADGAIADVWGDTALHIAARCGRAEVIKAFTTTLTKPEVHHPYFRVPYKSLPQDNVQSYNHDGRTPIHLAAQEYNSQPHRDALRALVRHARADIDYRRLGDGYAPAHIAIDNDDYECLLTCLKLGADSEVRNFKSETPQQLAYLYSDKDPEDKMVKLCQQYGAGSYQLEYAQTESVSDDEYMDIDEDPAELGKDHGLSRKMAQMAVD